MLITIGYEITIEIHNYFIFLILILFYLNQIPDDRNTIINPTLLCRLLKGLEVFSLKSLFFVYLTVDCILLDQDMRKTTCFLNL